MKPQKREKAVPTERLAPSNVTISHETIEHMRDCEAREWIQRFKKKKDERGFGGAREWWDDMSEKIRKTRGEKEIQDLRNRMNKFK